MNHRTPICPSGYGSTGPSSSLDRLDVAHGYAVFALRAQVLASLTFGDPPRVWPRGAPNAARPTSSTAFQKAVEERSRRTFRGKSVRVGPERFEWRGAQDRAADGPSHRDGEQEDSTPQSDQGRPRRAPVQRELPG